MTETATSPEQIRALYSAAAAKQLKARTSVLAQIEAFEPDWLTGGVHKEICRHLDGIITLVEQGAAAPGQCSGGPQLILQTPPGIGKTLMCGVHLISNAIGRHPDWQFIYMTHNFDKAAEVGVDTKRRIKDPRFSEIHPKFCLDPSADARDFFTTTLGGKVTFTGVDGDALGKRAHILVIDDPFKNEQEARSETHQLKVFRALLSMAKSRLHPYGAIVVIHQRWHTHDLIGRLLELKTRPWTNCLYPMVALEDCGWRKKGESVHVQRFSAEWCRLTMLEKIEAKEEWIWQAMYQQSPVLDTGMVFKREWFKFVTLDQVPKNVTWGVTTDFASTSGGGDSSVARPFCVDADENTYYFDPFHDKVEPNVAQQSTFDIVVERDAFLVFVEKGVLWNANKAGYREQMAKRRHYPRLIEFTRTRNKRAHASALLGRMANGKVFFLDTPFNRTVTVPQYMAFTGEQGVREEDDLVDADSLPHLSWETIPIPDRAVPLPEPEEIPELNRQILAKLAKPKKTNAYGLFAGDREPTDRLGLDEDEDD